MCAFRQQENREREKEPEADNRKQVEDKNIMNFRLDAPATPERVKAACDGRKVRPSKTYPK